MEPEGSLLHSQVPAYCPYPEPTWSNPYPHIPLPEDPSQYYPAIQALNNTCVKYRVAGLPKFENVL